MHRDADGVVVHVEAAVDSFTGDCVAGERGICPAGSAMVERAHCVEEWVATRAPEVKAAGLRDTDAPQRLNPDVAEMQRTGGAWGRSKGAREALTEAATAVVRERGARRQQQRRMDAVVADAFGRYLAATGELTSTGDPAVDLRRGWDVRLTAPTPTEQRSPRPVSSTAARATARDRHASFGPGP